MPSISVQTDYVVTEVETHFPRLVNNRKVKLFLSKCMPLFFDVLVSAKRSPPYTARSGSLGKSGSLPNSNGTFRGDFRESGGNTMVLYVGDDEARICYPQQLYDIALLLSDVATWPVIHHGTGVAHNSMVHLHSRGKAGSGRKPQRT